MEGWLPLRCFYTVLGGLITYCRGGFCFRTTRLAFLEVDNWFKARLSKLALSYVGTASIRYLLIMHAEIGLS